jgi:hypothetical protein
MILIRGFRNIIAAHPQFQNFISLSSEKILT